ncbi:hypothetical protein FIBSPDRAFT_884217 [Athelia psychrophila]|uniref:Uncharacterized protein n=1 Tax=Athelia psychrophila TaxID=1759441 RepID=A0A166T835_9AGAM|nr:hypothetical protein FIBSPDRAFT_884217 [Fibularhizoctonia sp. CBS 109695]
MDIGDRMEKHGLEDLTKDVACRAHNHHRACAQQGFSLQAQAGASTSAAAEESAWSGEATGCVCATPKGRTKGRGKGKGDEKRHSRRTHIVPNTRETASRLKTAVQPRSTLPKETVLVQKTCTQPKLLGRALDTEGSIFEHGNTLLRGGEAAACARRLDGRRGGEAGLDQLSEF